MVIENLHQLTRQCFDVENIVFDCTGDGQVNTGALIVQLWPQDARRIQQLKAAFNAEPLRAARHAWLIRRLRRFPAEHPVDKCGFADIRNTDNHDTNRLTGLPFRVPLRDFVRQHCAHGSGKFRHAGTASRVGGQHGIPLSAVIRRPQLCRLRVC